MIGHLPQNPDIPHKIVVHGIAEVEVNEVEIEIVATMTPGVQPEVVEEVPVPGHHHQDQAEMTEVHLMEEVGGGHHQDHLRGRPDAQRKDRHVTDMFLLQEVSIRFQNLAAI